MFGWETQDLDVGDGVATMWRVPGYGDFLERTTDPDVRRRQAGVGAPPGFEDAIGWLVSTDGPPHWQVTFSVQDADATAERAAELGGRVGAPPTDVPYARVAVLGDPQGAEFTVSQFRPPA